MKSRISSRAQEVRLGWQVAMFVFGGMLLLGFLGCAPAGSGRSSSQDRIHSDEWYRERHERDRVSGHQKRNPGFLAG